MNTTFIGIRTVLAWLAIGMGLVAQAQSYTPVTKGSKIEFKIAGNKEGEILVGRLGNLAGSIYFDKEHLEKSVFDVTINANTVQTGDKKMDGELKSEAYLQASKYPLIRIKADKVTTDKPGGFVYTLQGTLSIKGVSKPVKILFMTGETPTGKVFRGSLHFSRAAYGLGKKEAAADDVTVYLSIHAMTATAKG